MAVASRRLITIPISHYCEKARWALERAGLDYAEERHVQGVHQRVARRAGGGKTVPVLVAPEGVFPESEQIVAYADERLPEAERLFPADDALRADVEELSRRLDEGFGPAGRRLMYAQMFQHKKLMLRVNNQGVPTWEGWMLTTMWPLAVRWGKRELEMRPEGEAEDERLVRETLDEIAGRLSDGRRYLCGDRFTAADLTFAALSAAVIVPPRYGVKLPQPDELPAETARLVCEFREHPAGAYALRLFETERPPT